MNATKPLHNLGQSIWLDNITRERLGKRKSAEALFFEVALEDITRAPFAVNTMPENTPMALTDQGELSKALPPDGANCEEVLAGFSKAGIEVDALTTRLQNEGAKSFVKSRNDLMDVIASKSATLKEAAA
jgi:hypothetical protein